MARRKNAPLDTGAVMGKRIHVRPAKPVPVPHMNSNVFMVVAHLEQSSVIQRVGVSIYHLGLKLVKNKKLAVPVFFAIITAC